MKKIDKILFVLGLAVVCLFLLPWLILGEDAYVTYHDQLDGEMIAYILQAKYLGAGDILPEFMNGASKTALTPPAPLSVLLFLSGNYELSLLIMQLLGSIVGYVGMFLLVREITGKSLPALIGGGLYGVLPFLPVYGFSQYGLPLLLWCVLQLRKQKKTAVCFLYGLIFALNSSLALVGFAVLLVLGLWIVADIVREKSFRRQKKVLLFWITICAGYVVTNLSLIGQILGLGEGIVSHKAEYVLAAEGFLSGWLNGLLYGGQHSQDYHLSFCLAGLLVAGVGLIVGRITKSYREEKAASDKALDAFEKQTKSALLWSLVCNVLLAGAAAFWNCGVCISLRENMGALGAFQVDRLLWISPCLWYLFLGCVLAFLMEQWKKGWGCKIMAALGGVLMAAAVAISGLQIVKNSDVKANIQMLRNPDYKAMSYKDYYAIGVYDQVAEFMLQYTGMDQSEYRVVSLGIDPAAALYHGFYCLDGYSNNYSLEYKHAFREVIAPALVESDYLRDYYDNWGNRCYIFGSECPGYYTIEKNGFFFSHLEMDARALKNLGGDYLFSAAYIANAEELGLKLLREEPFETEESYYRIFVYEVM